jgi:hypothetical protein
MKLNIYHFWTVLLIILGVSACVQDPYDGVVSNERSIETVKLGEGFTQVGPAVINREEGYVAVQVLMEEGTDLSNVSPIIRASYKATTEPASGETVDFESTDNKHTYTVVAESGESREWVIELVPFTEEITGSYNITGQVLYGGTGPEWGGGGIFDLTDKDVWDDVEGPAAENDNTLTFTFDGVTPEGNTYGTLTNAAGDDGMYADYNYVAAPATDVNHFYRIIPAGTIKWSRNYSLKTITYEFEDGSTLVGKVQPAGTVVELGDGNKRTITAETSLQFTITGGADDWSAIYSDYDKIVKRPRVFWIDLEKQ